MSRQRPSVLKPLCVSCQNFSHPHILYLNVLRFSVCVMHVGSLALGKLAVKNLIGTLERKIRLSPSKFGLPFYAFNAFYGLFARWMREINPRD